MLWSDSADIHFNFPPDSNSQLHYRTYTRASFMSQTNDHMFTLLQIHILCAPKAVFWSLDFYFIVFLMEVKAIS